MNGVHDMGGMHGFGPVIIEENEPVFHETWEGRVSGINRVLARLRLVGRFAIESLDPGFYLASSYYGKWAQAMITNLIKQGLLTAEELEAKEHYYREHPEAPIPRREDPEEVQQVLTAMRTRQQLHREAGIVPRFRVGDSVVARNIHPAGHTRLPRYVRGKQGLIVRVIGVHEFPDTDPRGTRLTTEPQPIYNVRFAMEELWGGSSEPNGYLYIDMWESYLA